MKRVNDNEFDDLFRNKLHDAEFDSGYLEDDWDDLERMLDKPKKQRGIVFWLPVLSSAAAILLFLGWWMFRGDIVPATKPNQQVAAKLTEPKTENKTNSKPQQVAATTQSAQSSEVEKTAAQTNKVEQATTQNSKGASHALIANVTQKAGNVKSSPRVVSTQNQSVRQQQIAGQNRPSQTFDNGITATNNAANTAQLANNRQRNDLSTADAMLALNTGTKNAAVANINAKTLIDKPNILRYGALQSPVKDDQAVVNKQRRVVPLALTVLGAPEINGVGSFNNAKTGTNIGLLFSAGVFNKITISTGATYATMPYNTNIANYHTAYAFKTDPSAIEADCRALDIPVNIDYQLVNSHQNKFSIGTGLSSYIMLHESYDYYYNDPAAKGPTGFTVPNHGKYMFGIANVQATYTRQVNSKFGVSVQPYLKLPLTNIGYSQAKLQTAGVAVGLSWNINSLTKP